MFRELFSFFINTLTSPSPSYKEYLEKALGVKWDLDSLLGREAQLGAEFQWSLASCLLSFRKVN